MSERSFTHTMGGGLEEGFSDPAEAARKAALEQLRKRMNAGPKGLKMADMVRFRALQQLRDSGRQQRSA